MGKNQATQNEVVVKNQETSMTDVAEILPPRRVSKWFNF